MGTSVAVCLGMLRVFAAVLLTILPATWLSAATRLTHDIDGKATALAWEPTAFPLRYEIDAAVGRLGPDAAARVERAFDSWAAVEGADVEFESRGLIANAAAQSAGRIVISVADDLLSGQGALAMTSYSYDLRTGRLLDADIRLDPSLFDGWTNADLALEHEVGHLLGLDHSAVLSSVMYPWVGEGSQSEFDSDERLAISSIYPTRELLARGATLQGRVTGDAGGIFAAQVVAVDANGQPVGTVLTDSAGEFVLSGVPAGRYRLYAEPLDGPMLVDALQGSWRAARSAPFPTRFFGPSIDVENGRIYGNLVLNTAGPVQLNPRAVGATLPGEFETRLSTTPVNVRPGQTVRVTVGGDGFVSGMTELEILSPAFRRISDFEWWDGMVSATYAVDPGARPGSAVILVRSGEAEAALTGALRIQRPAKSRSVRR